jgi:hypothetical protein
LLGAAAVHQHDAALVQRHADREMMARVMSMYTPVLTASPAIGYVQAGLLEPLRPADDGGRQRPRDRAVGLACLLFLCSVRSLPWRKRDTAAAVRLVP